MTKGTMFIKKEKKGFTHFVDPSNNKTFAFIGRNSGGYFFAFGTPTQKGGYIAFNVKTKEEAENRILNSN
jgi:hypothetical protein